MVTDNPAHWIDISVPIHSGMVHWPSDPPVSLKRSKTIAAGDRSNVTHLDMGAHTGTHMDAPVHFIAGGGGIDSMPPDAAIGLARVVEIADSDSIKVPELYEHDPREGERLLFKTRNSPAAWEAGSFVKDFVYIAADAACLLAERRVRTVGVDYLSVGGFQHDLVETHVALLKAGIWIIEGLNLSEVEPGNYDLCCLPLKIQGCDGAPARALLRRTG